jgi:hypothetical protein
MFNVLCYNKNDGLILASVPSNIEVGNVVDVLGEDYVVTSAGLTMHMMTGSNKVVELEKYKQLKRKVS